MFLLLKHTFNANPYVIIIYRLNLTIYNLRGQKIATLISKKQQGGEYKIEWDASAFVSGVYFYKFETDNGFTSTRKLLLLK